MGVGRRMRRRRQEKTDFEPTKTARMPTIKKTRKTWEELITKGDWNARYSSKEWPSPMESEDEIEQETDISGECLEIPKVC